MCIPRQRQANGTLVAVCIVFRSFQMYVLKSEYFSNLRLTGDKFTVFLLRFTVGSYSHI